MRIGYARVSTYDQNLDMQISALTGEGCEKIYQEKVAGSKKDRPELNKMLDNLREGDTVVIWKLDRLGRSLKNLIEIINLFSDKNVSLVSIKDNVDTSTSTGRFTFAIFGALAEFEHDLIKERTQAGLNAARARGKVGGRKKKLSDKQLGILLKLSEDKTLSIHDICDQLKISKGTYYNYLKRPV